MHLRDLKKFTPNKLRLRDLKKLTPNKLRLRDLNKFTPNKLRLRDLNYRFPDTFISHIGKIKVVGEIEEIQKKNRSKYFAIHAIRSE